jgi:Domain of unknown function (DUF4424)
MGSALDAALEVLAQAGLPSRERHPCRADLHTWDRRPVQFGVRQAGPRRGARDAAQESHYRETYCTDGPFTSAAQSLYRKANAHDPKIRASEEYLSYVITSGANWAGPIGTFRLVVDKGDSTLVSFCGDGVRKIGPTTFETTAKGYTPKRDIDVLFINTNSNR